MGITDIFKRKKSGGSKATKQVAEYFDLINGYSPAFRSYGGGIYEAAITRAAIHCIATHASKLKPEVLGANNRALNRRLQQSPNGIMTTSQYLYKIATILMVDNTAFIVPLFSDSGDDVVGFYPVSPQSAEIVDYNNRRYLRFRFAGGMSAVEMEKVGIINQFLYRSDIFGENNSCMQPTLDLIDTNNQGIVNGINASANIRFIGRIGLSLDDEDIDHERKRLIASNLTKENEGGVLLVDSKYEDIKQVMSQPYTVGASEMEIINKNVYNYFGVNEKMLQNNYTSADWAAFYEGKIEPLALQLAQVHTKMLFSDFAQGNGNSVIFSANRMEYLSPEEKLNTVTQLFDRGLLTVNQGLEIYNMAPVADGNKRYIRKEYMDMTESEDVEELE